MTEPPQNLKIFLGGHNFLLLNILTNLGRICIQLNLGKLSGFWMTNRTDPDGYPLDWNSLLCVGTGAIHTYPDGHLDSFYCVVEIVKILKIKEGNEYVIALCSLVFMTRHLNHS